MTCPACQGKGYRLLRIGPTEGICPVCGGAGSVKETGETEGSWTFNYVPCRSCGGRGVKPIKDGGTRDGMVVTSSGPPTGFPSGREYEETDTEEEEEEEEESSGEESFISRYRTYLLIGGGALLAVALVASQASKKK